ncbi:MAG: GFA family protein [Gammaproteobacteria bacterium]
MNAAIEGGCLCGAVRYRATGKSLAGTLCHCGTCRHASGAPSVAWTVFRSSDFAFIAETPARFYSSPGVIRTFCRKCGTPVTYQRTSKPETIDATTATLDDPDAFAPTKEIWIEEKLAWESLNEAMEHYPGSSVGASGKATRQPAANRDK